MIARLKAAAARVEAWWGRARLYEPARLAAAWSAVRLLAGELTLTIPISVDRPFQIVRLTC